MSQTMIGFAGIAALLLLFATRMPVAFAMGAVGFVGFSLLTSLPAGLNMLSRSMYDVFLSYDLTTIPLFILMGQLAFNAGISRRLFATAYRFFDIFAEAWPWPLCPPVPPLALYAVPALRLPPPWPL